MPKFFWLRIYRFYQVWMLICLLLTCYQYWGWRRGWPQWSSACRCCSCHGWCRPRRPCPGRVNFVTVHHQFVFVILSLPKTLHYNGGHHLNMIEMSLGKIRRPRLFTETQMSPTLSTSINVSDFIKQIEWHWLWFFLSIPSITLNLSVNIKDFLYGG